MDRSYEAYCLVDPIFYDVPGQSGRGDEQYTVAGRAPPDGWDRSDLDDWVVYRPRSVKLPPQGWKIHVSATLDNAEEIVAEVWDYCIQRRIAFKFIRSRRLLLLRNAKYADRSSSGKFLTIYPVDETHFEAVLTELSARLEGREGPYILSDLRWEAGPLYVRYGGFALRWLVGANGEAEAAIEDPAGRLVPDRRRPAFELPSWVELPEFLGPHIAARNSVTFEGAPYRIESALHFSNGGGVYLAVDRRSGEHVVLKEARPHAGLSGDGADAVTRLQRERDILARLSGLDVVPAARDYFTLGEQHYLVQDFIEGSTLNSLFIARYPLTSHSSSDQSLADYSAWANGVCDRVERAVEAIHDRGVIIGDINPTNIIVQSSGNVVLIDWEVAHLADSPARPALGAADFAAPANLRSFAIDRYALALLRLFMFLPLTALAKIDPHKADQLGRDILQLFPCAPDTIARAVDTIAAGRPDPSRSRGEAAAAVGADPIDWCEARDSMARAVLASATPRRDDRLFPGDPKQFSPGGAINIVYGAAGVLHALKAVGAGRYPEHEEWLVDRSLRAERDVPLGFYDGLHGVAWVLEQLGRRKEAVKVLEMCLDRIGETWSERRLDLRSGLAGIGLNLAFFADATGDAALRDAAGTAVALLAESLGEENSVGKVSGGDQPYAGLVRGSSGPALLFIRWFERTGDARYLDLAAVALRQDLRRCAEANGALYVDEEWRLMPYLADGSVGIGMVLEDFLIHRADERFADAAMAIRHAAESYFYVQSGLFYGRAGMILHLARVFPRKASGVHPNVATQVKNLSWHRVLHEGNLAFPGEQLLRLSMDFATGTAGVMFALGAALHDNSLHLPFLTACGAKPVPPER